ncbi:retrovirus-related pol polyprotein from transposon TNT 1-94 [Tanacetum coccineum]
MWDSSMNICSLPTELKDHSSKFDELTKEVKGLKKQVHELEIELPGTLQWELLEEFVSLHVQVASVQVKLQTLDALPACVLSFSRQLFKSLDDWEVSSLQYMKRFQGTNNMSSECNNVKLAIRNDKSEVVCAMKGKKASHPPKPVPNLKQLLHLLHMDLCGPMRVKSINGNRYVLVIVEDYSRYMWVYFIKSKDEAPEVIKTFLKKTQVLLQAPVIIVRTDNDTKFNNQVLKEYFDSVGISHQASSARKILIFSCSVILWAEARLQYREDIGKRGAKGDIGFFIGYSANSCAYRV